MIIRKVSYSCEIYDIIKKAGNVQMNILEKICVKLGCHLSDIEEIIPDEKKSPFLKKR